MRDQLRGRKGGSRPSSPARVHITPSEHYLVCKKPFSPRAGYVHCSALFVFCHLLGFDNPRKALLTIVKEAVDNSLDAYKDAGKRNSKIHVCIPAFHFPANSDRITSMSILHLSDTLLDG